VLEVYRYTESFPQREIYGLVQQRRKAAVSIPANVAEGFKRRGKADKARFMNIAEGSLEESRYYLILAHDLGYGGPKGSRKNNFTFWRESRWSNHEPVSSATHPEDRAPSARSRMRTYFCANP
jgi:four helix bundle protein